MNAIRTIPFIHKGVFPDRSGSIPVSAGGSSSTWTGSGNIISGGSLTSLVQQATQSNNFSNGSGLNGSVTSYVYSGSNTLTQSGYTFELIIAESGGASDNINGLKMAGFTLTPNLVVYYGSGGVSGAGTWTYNGSVLALNFTNPLSPGSAYTPVMIYTTASSYSASVVGNATSSDSVSSNANVYGSV